MSILNQIVANKRLEIEILKNSGFKIEREIKKINQILKYSKPQFIAEIKPKSPSAGVIRVDLDPEKLILNFEKFAASGVSLLTDSKYFGGSAKLLQKARIATKLPILRKDFILDKTQIYQTAQMHADLILFIVKILTKNELNDFIILALELNLQPLIEVNTRKELDLALKTLDQTKIQTLIQNTKIIPIIGVNNRNLETFETDLNTSLSLINHIPEQYLSFSLSGIKNSNDLDTIFNANFDGVLIGQGLVQNPELLNYFKQIL